MSLFVVLALEVEPNTSELNQTANKLGYQIEYSPNVELKKQSGFIPVTLDGQKAGVELYSYSTNELPEQFKTLLPNNYKQGVVYQFRFGSNPKEAQVAFTSAIIINTKYNGVAIEDQSGTLLSVEQLAAALPYFSAM
jgi:hypothetical protein